MGNKNYKELTDKFLSAVGDSNIIRIQGEMIPFVIITNWLKFYGKDNRMHNIYPIFGIKNKTNVKFYIIDKKYAGVTKDIFRWYLNNEWSLDKNKKDYSIIKEKIDKEYENYFKDNLNKKDKTKSLSRIYDQAIKLVALTLYIERLDKEIISDVLSEYDLDINQDKIWDISEILDFISFETKNNKSILEIVKKKENLQKLQYVYSNYTYVGSKNYIEKEISKIKFKELIKEIIAKEKQAKTNKIRKEKLRKSLNKEERKVFDFINFAIFCRDDRKEPVQKFIVLMYNFAKVIISEWGIDENKIDNCLMADILKGKKYTINKLNEVKKREEGFVLLMERDNDYEVTYTGISDAAKIVDNRLSQGSYSNVKEIKGHVGSRGYYKGRVKIILNSSEHHKFKEGEVLVTGMTRPEFVPLMKKAGAIITDEGGITSHAAIVSRELGKPCIIGTKIATDVLKDNDLVEVDANKGIIRILKNEK